MKELTSHASGAPDGSDHFQRVAVHDRELTAGLTATAAAVEETGRAATVVIGDVRDEAAVTTFIAQAIEQLGAVDILVKTPE